MHVRHGSRVVYSRGKSEDSFMNPTVTVQWASPKAPCGGSGSSTPLTGAAYQASVDTEKTAMRYALEHDSRAGTNPSENSRRERA